MRAVRSFPGFFQLWAGSDSEIGLLFYVGLFLFLVGFAAGGWLIYGRIPRWRRSFKRVQRFLRDQAWQEGLDEVGRLQSLGRLSKVREGCLRHAGGEARHVLVLACLRLSAPGVVIRPRSSSLNSRCVRSTSDPSSRALMKSVCPHRSRRRAPPLVGRPPLSLTKNHRQAGIAVP